MVNEMYRFLIMFARINLGICALFIGSILYDVFTLRKDIDQAASELLIFFVAGGFAAILWKSVIDGQKLDAEFDENIRESKEILERLRQDEARAIEGDEWKAPSWAGMFGTKEVNDA